MKRNEKTVLGCAGCGGAAVLTLAVVCGGILAAAGGKPFARQACEVEEAAGRRSRGKPARMPTTTRPCAGPAAPRRGRGWPPGLRGPGARPGSRCLAPRPSAGSSRWWR